MRRRLAVVFAHPHDDAWMIGGTLALYAGCIEPAIVLCTSGGNGPIWELAEFYRAAGERHLPFGDGDEPFNPVGVPDERIAVDVDVTRVYERKLAAIERHRSQIRELTRIPRDLQPLHFARECFVQAWPPRDGAAPIASDPFEGLEA
jgi:LmbE family N-acetylglucosaminyl deacetylase